MEWLNLLLDPLFRIPLAAGLLTAVVLPIVGCLLRLRDEWLAALGYAYIASTGALAGLAVHLPTVIGGPLAAVLVGAAKSLAGARGNGAYAVMVLFGWGTTLLVAANTPLGESMAHALADGQLYFAGPDHLGATAIYTGVTLASLPWLNRRLVRARFMPEHEQANALPAWRWHLGFDVLAALGMAVGTAVVGLMGAFALVFLPAWTAFRLAPGWRWALGLSCALGAGGYLIAFVVAMALDQPFGPVLVAALLGVCGTVVTGDKVKARLAADGRRFRSGVPLP